MNRPKVLKLQVKQLEQAIAKRKQMMKEVGYESGDDNDLKHSLEMTRCREKIAELKAKKDDLKSQLKVEMARNADLKMKHWGMPSKPSKQARK